MKQFTFRISGILAILEDVNPEMFAPEIVISNDGSEIEFEWFFNASNHVSLNLGGEYGDGIIFEFLDGKSARFDYCPKQLKESTNKLMNIVVSTCVYPNVN